MAFFRFTDLQMYISLLLYSFSLPRFAFETLLFGFVVLQIKSGGQVLSSAYISSLAIATYLKRPVYKHPRIFLHFLSNLKLFKAMSALNVEKNYLSNYLNANTSGGRSHESLRF
jgi:hypothetical protein